MINEQNKKLCLFLKLVDRFIANSLQTSSKGTEIDSIFWLFLGPTWGPTWFIFGGVRVRARVGFVRVAHFESETALQTFVLMT